MFPAPQWHGATQTHFPPRPRKSQWHCDITNVLWPHGLSTHKKQTYRVTPPMILLTSDTPRLRQHVSRSPVARRHAITLPTKAAHIGTATSRTYFGHTVRHTLKANAHDTPNSPATRRVYASMFRAPQWHGATQTHFPPRPRKSQWHCDITNVLWPRGLSTH